MSNTFEDLSPEEGFRLRGEQKLKYVSEMFDRIAVSYDKVNIFISLGQTSIWRLRALWGIRPLLTSRAKVLDVGCGTGWVSWFLNWKFRDLQLNVEGLDCSQVMLQEARRLYPKSGFTFGDVCNLPYTDGSFQMVTTVYTLRNFPELFLGLKEMVRVTSPGGTIIIVDAFPPQGIITWLMKVWLNYVVPPLASCFIERKPYEYLASSIQNTVSPGEVSDMLEQLGCEQPIQQRKYTFGAAVCLIARKPAQNSSI
mmetsp:Transcript_22686/g.31652  ORF Transcript_22686/g.31652 Transcript_22686/m.31652 type:complete len:254 (-) Transcript_22686:21-782(-)|eukprot:CAMPEP_0196589936 /NCGR_PEP_ID=MMETSP1081-20130531/65047_1 /TAXON_ID=36882 /ORGANISM="Pyramimonas amylifera, Strain CCMP720" /LENGTH=253 /DNA_ID=CAMNT_0041912879 /DNA_START=118 /DNA_END=879 /DNA_ORIENTATION=-